MPIPSSGNSKLISLPISELKTTKVPIGNDRNISPKIIDTNAE